MKLIEFVNRCTSVTTLCGSTCLNSSKYRCIYIVTHFLMASHVETYSASRGLLLKCSYYIISSVIQTYQAEQMQNSKIQVLSTDHFLKSILFGAGRMYVYLYIYVCVCVCRIMYIHLHILSIFIYQFSLRMKVTGFQRLRSTEHVVHLLSDDHLFGGQLFLGNSWGKSWEPPSD